MALNPGIDYIIRARHEGDTLGWSGWSSVNAFETASTPPTLNAPTLTLSSPTSSTIKQGFIVSDLSVTNGSATPTQTEIEFAKTTDTNWTSSVKMTVSYADHTVTTYGRAYPITPSVGTYIYPDTDFKARARHNTTELGWTPYSNIPTWKVLSFQFTPGDNNISQNLDNMNNSYDEIIFTANPVSFSLGTQTRADFDDTMVSVSYGQSSRRSNGLTPITQESIDYIADSTGTVPASSINGHGYPKPAWNCSSYVLGRYRGRFTDDGTNVRTYTGAAPSSGTTGHFISPIPSQYAITIAKPTISCSLSGSTITCSTSALNLSLPAGITSSDPGFMLTIAQGAPDWSIDYCWWTLGTQLNNVTFDASNFHGATRVEGWFNVLLSGPNWTGTRVLCSEESATWETTLP